MKIDSEWNPYAYKKDGSIINADSGFNLSARDLSIGFYYCEDEGQLSDLACFLIIDDFPGESSPIR